MFWSPQWDLSFQKSKTRSFDRKVLPVLFSLFIYVFDMLSWKDIDYGLIMYLSRLPLWKISGALDTNRATTVPKASRQQQDDLLWKGQTDRGTAEDSTWHKFPNDPFSCYHYSGNDTVKSPLWRIYWIQAGRIFFLQRSCSKLPVEV